jgi:hypothetical protein
MLPMILWLAGLGVGWLTLKDWIQLNDEGLMLQAASRISQGQVPYRDFWWFYPPGQSYLLALVWKLTGPSLVPWRVVRALSDATVALLAWKLALRRGNKTMAICAWAVSVLAVSSATGPHPYPIAMALALGCLLLLEDHPLGAGVLAGLVGVWRIEFAAYLTLGVVLGLLVRSSSRKAIVRYLLAAAGTALVLYLPVVLAAGVSRSWELLVRYPVLEFGKYQTLPFPLVWDGGGNARGLDLLAQFLSYHLPLSLVIGLIASLAALALTLRPGRWIEVSLGVFGVGMANYLVVRADAFHTGPLAVVDSVLAAWAISAVLFERRTRRSRQAPFNRRRAALAVAAAVLAGLSMSWSLADTGWKRIREVREARNSRPIELAVADGVRELPVTRCSLRGQPIQLCSLADLENAVREVDRIVPAGSPIFVTTKRSDLVTAGAPLFYVLAGRQNATRYDIAAPGVVTSVKVQLEEIAALKRTGAVVVRYSAGITASPEPNLAGKSSGVTLLDVWLKKNYREVASFGVWSVLEPRG